jgi:hypothetical protein
MQWSQIAKRQANSSHGWCAIVGAPRCGTTSLARYLGSHPDICVANVKEPHFFSRRDLGAESDSSAAIQSEYIDRFFPHRRPGQLLLDGSVSYLYAPDRLKSAIAEWPGARFIIAVRNPLEMVPSLHQRHICNGDEDVAKFEGAWALVEERRQGKHIPRSCIDPRLLDYPEIGRIGKYVGRFFEAVGRKRCFVSVFDDLVADPSRQYRRVLDFLSLPDDERRDFEPFRASTGLRSVRLQRLLKRPPIARTLIASEAALRRDGMAVEERIAALPGVPSLKALRKRLLKWNRTGAPPRELSERLRSEMCAVFADDIDELSTLLGRDLSHWLIQDSFALPKPTTSGFSKANPIQHRPA